MRTPALATSPIALRGFGNYSNHTAGAKAVIYIASNLAFERSPVWTCPRQYLRQVCLAGPPGRVAARPSLNPDHPCPNEVAFRTHRNTEAFARTYMPALLSWRKSILSYSLKSACPISDQKVVIDRCSAACQADVAAAPDSHDMDYVFCFMVITKILAD